MNEYVRSKAERRDVRRAFVWAFLLHISLLVILAFSVTLKPQQMEYGLSEKVETVKASLVTIDDLKKKKEIEKKLRKQQELEKKRRKEQERKKAEEKKKLEEKKKAEEKKKREQEAERKRIALKKKKEEQRKKDEIKKKEDQKKKDEKRKKALAQQKAEEQRRKLEDEARQKAFAEMIAADEKREAQARAAALANKYNALIMNRVAYFWDGPPGVGPGLLAILNVRLTSSGDVLSVKIVDSSGNREYDRSVESAILKASPLPIPAKEDDAAVNKEFQDLNVQFPSEALLR